MRVRAVISIDHLERCPGRTRRAGGFQRLLPDTVATEGPEVADPARFGAAVAEVLATAGEGEVVSYQWGPPTPAIRLEPRL